MRTDAGFVLELASGATSRRWLVPRGPSLDPAHRRVAKRTSDSDAHVHNAASNVALWDEGRWSGSASADALSNDEPLVLTLAGGKLHGAWRLEPSGNRWALIKEPDAFAVAGADISAIDEALQTMDAASPQTRSKLTFMPLALATLAEAPPAGDKWVHEVKLDGYRIEALVQGDTVRLLSRNGKDWTARFPTIVEALQALDITSAVLDGEVVAISDTGVSSFQQLQQSFDAPSSPTLRYYVFDLLALDDTSLVAEPLERRLPLLAKLLGRRTKRSVVQPTARFDPRKGDVLQQACDAGEEGVISKRLDARYVAGRGKTWLKSKCGKRQEFVIVGYTDPQGSRSGFGSLLLGVYDHGTLQYAGRVGTGFDMQRLDSLYKQLRAIETQASPLHARPPGVPLRTIHWVEPRLVAEVAFTEWTADGLLRHPSFKALREDKRPSQVRREA